MTDKRFWIGATDDIETHPALDEVHDELRGPGGGIYNLYRAFSLRPAPLAPAVRHYRAVLQGDENTLGKWRLEMIATYVAIRTSCGYARANHGANFLHLLDDPARGAAMLRAMERDDLCNEIFSPRETVVLAYARKLTDSPAAMDESDLEPLRANGLTDGEILEVVQTCACFAYWGASDQRPGHIARRRSGDRAVRFVNDPTRREGVVGGKRRSLDAGQRLS